MNDRTWLLCNTAALACAKNCIRLIKEEFGIKLTLSDTKLLPKIEKISHKQTSQALKESYQELQGYAGITPHHGEALNTLGSSIHDAGQSFLGIIEHHGKEYPKFDDSGKEFKGVYRGNARFG